eukprot:m.123299 g.123299  ORF g.123299 m.123299 type:complete len:128 (+) comp28979_c3_seq1:198-581(+)
MRHSKRNLVHSYSQEWERDEQTDLQLQLSNSAFGIGGGGGDGGGDGSGGGDHVHDKHKMEESDEGKRGLQPLFDHCSGETERLLPSPQLPPHPTHPTRSHTPSPTPCRCVFVSTLVQHRYNELAAVE